MEKIKKTLKILVYGISILGFLDLLVNPKPYKFLNSKINLITSFLVIVGLMVLILKEVLKTKLNIGNKTLKGIKIIILLLIIIYSNVFLKRFSFFQNVDYIIVTYLSLPIIFTLNELITEKIKIKYFAILGILLLVPTLVYFGKFYEPYEAYSKEGIPIIFIHHRIRNWICYIGIVLILLSLLRINTKHNNQ